MGLREQAAADVKAILEDAADFGWDIAVTSPDGVTAALRGLSNDISEALDPDTGEIVRGRVATVALAVASLTAAGLGLPRSVESSKATPWLVRFADIAGKAHTFKVADALPDRTLGVVLCRLEAYQQ